MIDFKDDTQNKLSKHFMDCIQESLASVFTTICGAPPVFHENVLCNLSCEGVVGTIPIIGQSSWTLMMGFPKETATSLAQKFAGFSIDFESPDMNDVVGELANVLGGDFISRLATVGVQASISLPKVAKGKETKLLLSNNELSYWMYFLSSQGKFCIKMAPQRKCLL